MFKHLTIAAGLLACTALPAMAQTTQNLAKPAPDGAIIDFQLTDGTVMVQGNNDTDWWKLTPDINGSYVNGKWSKLASLPSSYAPYAFASAVLADGRVLIEGGEYNQGQFAFTDLGSIYDPVANTWTSVAPPKNWDFIGDSPSSVLPNGKFLLGRKFDKRIAELDPATLTWKELHFTGKKDFDAEEGWTLQANGTVLTYDVKAAPNSEIYDPSKQTWTSAGSTVANLASPPSIKSIPYGNGKVYHPPGEVGPGILRPDGTIFATGGTNKGATSGHTAIYTPPSNGQGIGTWAAGPNFPSGDDAGDSFASLLPTGNVLVEGESGTLYEFNGSTLTASKFNGGGGSLMVLPTGEILVNGAFVYRAAGSVNPAWAPTVTSVPSTLTRGSTYVVQGTQFNGLSQANAFGDELQTATNYPLVRITNTATGHVFYARTHGHSSMGVATGTATISTNFDVPAAAETGASTLAVVANGIASTGVSVTLQ
jgi:hypothetical protein